MWKSRDIQGWRPDQIAAAGIVKTFQNPQLFLELTVLENVADREPSDAQAQAGLAGESPNCCPGDRDAAIAVSMNSSTRVLVLCRLDALRDELAASLSYGQEKMLGVAMALMCEPELLLLDEPASGLGDAEIVNLEAVLRDLRAHGTTLCIIDHKVDFLRRTRRPAIGIAARAQDRRGHARRGSARPTRGGSLSGPAACQGNRVNHERTIRAGLLAFSLFTLGGGEGRGEAGAARTGPAPPTPGTLRAARPSSPCPLLPEGGRRGNQISIPWPVRASPYCPGSHAHA